MALSSNNYPILDQIDPNPSSWSISLPLSDCVDIRKGAFFGKPAAIAFRKIDLHLARMFVHGPFRPGSYHHGFTNYWHPCKKKKKKAKSRFTKRGLQKTELKPLPTKLTSSRTQKYLSILKYNLEYKHNCYPKSQKQQKQIFLFLFFLSLFFPLSFFKLGFLRNEECIHERHSQEKRWIPFWVLAQK